MKNRITVEDLRAAMSDLADCIERGDAKSATINAVTSDGEVIEHHISLETEEERLGALLAIRTFLGQVH